MSEEQHKEVITNVDKKTNKGRGLVLALGATVVLLLLIGGGAYWYVSSKTVYIDQSVISAPVTDLSPSSPGVLEQVFVNVGDMVTVGEPIARVGDQIVEAQTKGEIVSVNNNIGAFINPAAGQGTVASMVDPSQLRVVGHLDENKGLSQVKVGDPVIFTVDAFGGKTFKGVVDEISPTSRSSAVVFSISNQRPTNEFDVKVRFSTTAYPELKNGMSARIWIYKQ
jgi:multidrug resistance efflux pump